jgi:glycosyltransferase involved in cell wall biosynthesis
MKGEEVFLQSVNISVILPVFNEEESLSALWEQLRPVLDRFGGGSEAVFIDDGSTDGSNVHLSDLAARDSRVKVIVFRKNFGQTASWAAGLDHASGDIVIFMDADLQNDPADIPLLVEKIVREGYDVVSGWRKNRKDPFLTRRLPSSIANALISFVTRVRLHDYGCSLKAYRREVIKHVRLYGEMHRFLPAYAATEGARIAELPVSHHPRRFGRSKYGLWRTFKVLLDLITVTFLGAFSTKPLYFFGLAGGISFLLGMVSFCVVAYRVLILERKEATPLVFMMVVFFVTAVQFVLMGLLAEIAVRIYHEAQAKPVYRIRELRNLDVRRAGLGTRRR